MKAKKSEVQGVIGKLDDEQFKELVALTAKINDFVAHTDAPATEAAAPDDQHGVAVILDRESDEVCCRT
jgi:hypothetical protein